MISKLIYICSEFPGISHTFIFREIETLQQNGVDISTVSINLPQHVSKMGALEKGYAARTMYMKKTPLLKAGGTLLRLFLKMPAGTIRMAQATAPLAIRRGPGSLKKAVGYFIEAVLLVNFALGRKVSHLHVHFANPAATVALIASRSGAVTYSLSVHGPDVFYNVEKNLLKEKVLAATFVRCISHYCRSQLCRLVPYAHWPKLQIVRCGIDPDVFSPRSTPSNTTTHLLCVGRLTINKGQHILIEACARLKKNGIPFHLTLVGDGEDRSSLEQQVSALGLISEVTFTGAMGQDEVRALYRSADVFVLPSFAEGVPVVLMEAMAMEIPVISTTITGIPELIESGKDGLLVPPGDSDALYRNIKYLLEEPEICERLGKKAREKVGSRYDLGENCRRLMEVFRERVKSA